MLMADKTLLILGNGFDRAHTLKSTGNPLPTSYADFLNDVKKNHNEAFNTIYKTYMLNGYDGMGKPKYKKGSSFSIEVSNQKYVKEIEKLLLENKFDIALDKINLYIDKYVNFCGFLKKDEILLVNYGWILKLKFLM